MISISLFASEHHTKQSVIYLYVIFRIYFLSEDNKHFIFILIVSFGTIFNAIVIT
jgi:hypothetical protein